MKSYFAAPISSGDSVPYTDLHLPVYKGRKSSAVHSVPHLQHHHILHEVTGMSRLPRVMFSLRFPLRVSLPPLSVRTPLLRASLGVFLAADRIGIRSRDPVAFACCSS